MVGFTEPAVDAADETRVETLIDKAVCTSVLERDEALALLRANTWQAENLFSAADRVRMETVGDAIHLRGVIEFSNFCGRNCLHCGMRAGNSVVERYRISADEVVRTCDAMRGLGLRTVMLESGEDPAYTADELCKMIEAIRRNTGLEVGLSIGERQHQELEALKQAGAAKFLLRHETSDSTLYQRLRPEMNLSARMGRLEELKRLGYEVEGGSLVGLPGQTIHSLVEDLLLFQGYEVHMAVIGPYIPASGTPMELERGTWRPRRALTLSVADKKHTVAEFVLKLLALTRLMLPETCLPSTTSLASLLPHGREMGLLAGANMVMLNFTPPRYKELYRVYDDRISVRENVEDTLQGVKALGEKMGRRVC